MATEKQKVLFVRRWSDGNEACAVFNLSDTETPVSVPIPAGRWHKRLDSAEQQWGGPGSQVSDMLISENEAGLSLSPKSFVLFVKEASL